MHPEEAATSIEKFKEQVRFSNFLNDILLQKYFSIFTTLLHEYGFLIQFRLRYVWVLCVDHLFYRIGLPLFENSM